MGRVHERDERGEHEGHLVGYVPRDWVPQAAATAIGSSRPVAVLERYGTRMPLRELGLLASDNEHDVHGIHVVGYACACGWRSPYRELGTPFEWSPSIVHWSEWMEDLLAKKWWTPHVEAETPTSALSAGLSPAHSVRVAFDMRREVATSLLALLNALSNDDYNRIAKRLIPERAESANQGLCELGDELGLVLREDD